MTEERFSLKDHLFNEAKVAYLAGLLESGLPGFDRSRFESSIMSELAELELKQRIALIAKVLGDHLSSDFEVAAEQILSVLPPPLDPNLGDNDFGDFIIAPFGRYVEDNGQGSFETSMSLLRELTMRFSMEGPIRPFIDAYPARALDVLTAWASDDNYHVRRLVSEGTRPRLPWAPRLQLDVRSPLPLLDVLHADPTRYVTRSVANHLNDIAKIEPALVIDRLSSWTRSGRQDPVELSWMTNHALRTLVKKGDPDALRLLGFGTEPNVDVGRIELSSPTVSAGGTITFSIPLHAHDPSRLLIDYSIGFVKKSGERAPRVFKLKQFDMEAGEHRTIEKTHRFRANATTYTLYAGTHRLALIVNGTERASIDFELTTGDEA